MKTERQCRECVRRSDLLESKLEVVTLWLKIALLNEAFPWTDKEYKAAEMAAEEARAILSRG